MSNLNINFFDAVKNNDINLVESLIGEGVDVNLFSDDGEVPLHIAASRGYLELLIKLLEKGADVDIRDKRNWKSTPLQRAVKYRKLEVAKLLIDNGADVNAVDVDAHFARHGIGGTLLHWAARHCDEELMKFLIDNGADVNAMEKDGRTPLCLLVKHSGSLNSMRYLVDKGADLNNSCGGTPLYWAHRLPEAANLLIEIGSNVNSYIDPYGDHKSPLHLADYLSTVKLILAKGASIDPVDKYCNTPLHHTRRLSITKLLIDNGANVKAINKDGDTPLHKVSNLATAKLLVESGANVNTTNHKGCTPLHLAVNCSIAEYLIEKGADFKAVAEGGKTVLHTVAEIDRPTIYSKFKNAKWLVDFYVQKGMDVNITDDFGNTPLHLCSKQYNTDVAERLLENGANINAVNNNNKRPEDEKDGYSIVANMLKSIDKLFTAVINDEPSPKVKNLIARTKVMNCVQDEARLTLLHYAVQKSQKAVIESLLAGKRGPTFCKRVIPDYMLDEVLEKINVNACSTDNWTPLHYASQRNDKEIVKLLLESGAVYNIKTVKGHTPLELTKSNEIKNLFVLAEKLFEAVTSGDCEQVYQCVKEEKVIINALVSSGCSALLCAIRSGYQNIALFLIEKGVNVTLINNEGCSALHFAAIKNDQKIVDALLNRVKIPSRLNAFVNTKSQVGNTALHIATENGYFEIVKSLLQCGAVYNTKNEEGKQPVDISTNQDVTNLLNLIEELFENAYYDKLVDVDIFQNLDPEMFSAITCACDSEGNTLTEIINGNENLSVREKLSKMKLLKGRELVKSANKISHDIKVKVEGDDDDDLDIGFSLFD